MSENKDNNESPSSHPTQQQGVLGNLKTGLKVVLGELKWTFLDMIRGYESRQMRRRLTKEYAALGKMARQRMDVGNDAPPSRDGEAGIILSQIEFLEREIEFLSRERSNSRKMDLERRRRDLGLDDDE